jgi:hypothetical protein
VKPAISNIERSKAVKEFIIARAPNKYVKIKVAQDWINCFK